MQIASANEASYFGNVGFDGNHRELGGLLKSGSKYFPVNGLPVDRVVNIRISVSPTVVSH